MLQRLNSCTSQIGAWMQFHFLKLNCEKTELVVITTPTLSNHSVLSVDICGSNIFPNSGVRDLGVDLDSTLKMEPHIRAVCKRAFHQIHLIHCIRRFINEDAARTLVQANVVSLLDYCNGVLMGLPDALLKLLQRVQNCAAHVIKCAPKSSSITPILKDLHWLPINYRVQYKVLILTFKALNGLAPPYLTDLLEPYQPIRALRSMHKNLLSSRSFNYKAYGSCSFEVLAPRLWNALSPMMRKITSIDIFKRTLKTHLCYCAFENVSCQS